jgi:hypothetical protein
MCLICFVIEDVSSYSKNNENVTKITIFFVKIVTSENLWKNYEKLTKFKTKIK